VGINPESILFLLDNDQNKKEEKIKEKTIGPL